MALGGVSLLMYEKRRLDKEEEHPMSQKVSEKGMIQHFIRLKDFMTPRGFDSEIEITNLIRTGAFISGGLSHMNIGMVMETEKSLTKSGRIWKDYKILYKGESKVTKEIRVNYVTASNAELATALMLGEALPQVQLSENIKLVFSPVGEGSEVISWVESAQEGVSDNPLMVGGVDWRLLESRVEQFISDHKVGK